MLIHRSAALLLIPALVAPASAAPLVIDRLAPYLDSRRGRKARAALARHDFTKAVNALLPLARRGRERKQAQFLLGYALLQSAKALPRKTTSGQKKRLKLLARAMAIFERLEQSYPLLRDYHRQLRAQAAHQRDHFARAAELAAGIPAGSALATEARVLRARALWKAGRRSDAAHLWRSYLRHSPYGVHAARAHLRVAQAELRVGTIPADSALRHLRRVLSQTPLSSQAKAAKTHLRAAAKRWPAIAGKTRLNPDERYVRARALFRAMRNRLSERAFAELAKEPTLSPLRRCRVLFYQAKSVFKARQRDRAAPLFAAAAKACRRAKDLTHVVKSLYSQGRGLYRLGRFEKAAELFLALEKEFRHHSYADDARLRAAEAYSAAKDTRKVELLLSQLPTLYPKGDQARESLWRLAKRAYFDGRLDRSRRLLERIERELGPARKYYAEGRALYWIARVHQRQGRRELARRAFEQCIRSYPLSYYSLQSFNRLRERHPRTFRKLHRELLAPTGKKAGRWVFRLGSLSRDPNMRRGIALARLGFGRWAARELRRAGVSTRRGRPKDKLWLAATLFDRAGLWHLSHQVPRSRDWSWKRAHPSSENFRRWVVAYPKAFAPIVQLEARRSGIPKRLAWSIMREESGFTTQIESYANAIGLMQLILPTARAAATRFGIRVNRAALGNPRINIKLGAAYLGFLSRTFARNVPLTIAGYNAGHGAVFRWLRNYRRHTLDELLERVPYDQTRRYTKRVLASFFAYSVLYKRGRVPRIRQGLPVPKKVRP